MDPPLFPQNKVVSQWDHQNLNNRTWGKSFKFSHSLSKYSKWSICSSALSSPSQTMFKLIGTTNPPWPNNQTIPNIPNIQLHLGLLIHWHRRCIHLEKASEYIGDGIRGNGWLWCVWCVHSIIHKPWDQVFTLGDLEGIFVIPPDWETLVDAKLRTSVDFKGSPLCGLKKDSTTTILNKGFSKEKNA